MNLVQMSLTAGILILGIIVFRTLFIHRVFKKVMVLLWEIAILRLVLPIAVPLPFPGIGDLGAVRLNAERFQIVEGAVVNTATEIGGWRVALDPGAVESEGENTVVVSSAKMIDQGSYILWGIYGAAALALILGSVYLYFRDSQSFREGLPMPEEERRRLLLLLEEEDRKRMSKVKLRVSDRTASPVTYGVLRPAIVFPKGSLQNPEKEISFWLCHELVHIRHHDNLKKLIAHGALCIHWFNPLVWLMYFLFNRDMELLCDEAVVRKKRESRRDYALALLSMAQRKSLGFQTGLGFGKNAVTERITAVMKVKQMTWKGILGAGAALVIALTVFGSHYVSYASEAQTLETFELAEYTVTADVVQEQEFSYEAADEEGLVEEASQVSEDTLKSIEEVIGEYREFGLTMRTGRGDYQLYYEEEPVCFFADNTIPEEEGFSGRLFMRPAGRRNGRTGVITQRDQNGEITGLKHLTEEESEAYTGRWR